MRGGVHGGAGQPTSTRHRPGNAAPDGGAIPHAELACFVSKVPYFEAMGFQVLAARVQVVMNTRDRQTEGLLAVLDIAPIYNSVEVRQIHAYLLKQNGKRAMTDAEKQRDRHLDQMTRQARLFVQERLGE